MARQHSTQTPAQATSRLKLVAKFSDADGAKLVVNATQQKTGDIVVVARHSKKGAKRPDVGMRTVFAASGKDRATARFNELVALAETAGWTKAQKATKSQTGAFDVMPAAAVPAVKKAA